MRFAVSAVTLEVDLEWVQFNLDAKNYDSTALESMFGWCVGKVCVVSYSYSKLWDIFPLF